MRTIFHFCRYYLSDGLESYWGAFLVSRKNEVNEFIFKMNKKDYEKKQVHLIKYAFWHRKREIEKYMEK
jgi:hypothetical protein